MHPPSPIFENPPVVETVLGVHFAPLAKLSSGHLGWFWKEHLGRTWDQAIDAPALLAQFEMFDVPLGWEAPGISIQTVPSVRLQISNKDRDRMLQLQASRLHYNWRKTSGPYPRFESLRQEFLGHFEAFRRFAAEAGIGEVVPIQWELTYVDYEPPGKLWKSPADWYEIIPGLLGQGLRDPATRVEVVAAEWRCELVPRRGRLYISVNLGRFGDKGDPGLMIQTTARGPISKDSGTDLAGGLDFAHERIIHAFWEVISTKAKKAWGLQT